MAHPFSTAFQSVTEAVKVVVVPLIGTFLVSSGNRDAVRCGRPVVPVVPKTAQLVVMLSVDCDTRLQE